MKLRLDLLEHLTAEDILEEVNFELGQLGYIAPLATTVYQDFTGIAPMPNTVTQ